MSIVFSLVFATNPILSCFFLFFLKIHLYFLIPAVITQIFNPTAELTIPNRTPPNEAKVEIRTHPLTAEKKTRKALQLVMQTTTHVFMLFTHQIIMFYFFKKIISCFIYFFSLKSRLTFSFAIFVFKLLILFF